MVPEKVDLPCAERLYMLGLHFLEFSKIRGDLIEVYKIHTELNKIHIDKIYPLPRCIKLRIKVAK